MLFRMGDFYEMFYEDALVAARALELTLTSRSKDAEGGGIPMCGVPFTPWTAISRGSSRRVTASPSAIRSRIRARRRASSNAKSCVVVSPGTLTDAGYLDAREPAFHHGSGAGAR